MVVDFMLLALAAAALVCARNFPDSGAAAFPVFLAWAIIALAGIDAIARVARAARKRAGANAKMPPRPAENSAPRPAPGAQPAEAEVFDARSLAIVAMVALYLAAMPHVGFVFSSGLLSAAALRLRGASNWPRALGFGFGLAALIYFVFAKFMNVALPVGILN